MLNYVLRKHCTLVLLDDYFPFELVAQGGEQGAVAMEFGDGGVFFPTIPVAVRACFVRNDRHVVGEKGGLLHPKVLEQFLAVGGEAFARYFLHDSR